MEIFAGLWGCGARGGGERCGARGSPLADSLTDNNKTDTQNFITYRRVHKYN
jgi:hypothetical protein